MGEDQQFPLQTRNCRRFIVGVYQAKGGGGGGNSPRSRASRADLTGMVASQGTPT